MTGEKKMRINDNGTCIKELKFRRKILLPREEKQYFLLKRVQDFFFFVCFKRGHDFNI